MTLLVDERDAPSGSAGVHAFIVGISCYPHLDSRAYPDKTLGLKSLYSAALTAYRVANWLIDRSDNLPRPLLSCRLLAAPTAFEIEKEPGLPAVTDECDWATFARQADAWRQAASTHPDNVSLFYFAGHGLQKSHGEQVLLLQDFADGLPATLAKAVSGHQLMEGMAPSPKRLKIARTQVYFFDACRLTAKKIRDLEKAPVGALWDVDPVGVDERNVAAFRTAAPGRASFGVKGLQTIFSLALMDCLEGGAAEIYRQDPVHGDIWGVSCSSLSTHVRDHLDRLNAQHGTKQGFAVDELRGKEVFLHVLDQPPDVDVVLRLVPRDPAEQTAVTVTDRCGRRVWDLPMMDCGLDYTRNLIAGSYTGQGRIVRAKEVADLPPQAFTAAPASKRWYFRVPAER